MENENEIHSLCKQLQCLKDKLEGFEKKKNAACKHDSYVRYSGDRQHVENRQLAEKEVKEKDCPKLNEDFEESIFSLKQEVMTLKNHLNISTKKAFQLEFKLSSSEEEVTTLTKLLDASQFALLSIKKSMSKINRYDFKAKTNKKKNLGSNGICDSTKITKIDDIDDNLNELSSKQVFSFLQKWLKIHNRKENRLLIDDQINDASRKQVCKNSDDLKIMREVEETKYEPTLKKNDLVDTMREHENVDIRRIPFNEIDVKCSDSISEMTSLNNKFDTGLRSTEKLINDNTKAPQMKCQQHSFVSSNLQKLTKTKGEKNLNYSKLIGVGTSTKLENSFGKTDHLEMNSLQSNRSFTNKTTKHKILHVEEDSSSDVTITKANDLQENKKLGELTRTKKIVNNNTDFIKCNEDEEQKVIESNIVSIHCNENCDNQLCSTLMQKNANKKLKLNLSSRTLQAESPNNKRGVPLINTRPLASEDNPKSQSNNQKAKNIAFKLRNQNELKFDKDKDCAETLRDKTCHVNFITKKQIIVSSNADFDQLNKEKNKVDENNLNSPSSNSYNKYDQQDTKSLYLANAKPEPASLGNIEAQSNDMLQFQIEDKNNNDNITSESFSKYSYDCKSSCEIEPGSFESGVDSFRGGW